MPPASDRPLQKVTMNFYRDDVAELVRIYGNGWTTEVREIITSHLWRRRWAIEDTGESTDERD